MKKFLLLPLTLVFASNAAMAANSVDLRVTGTITPAACNITIDNGNFDLGSIEAKDLSATERTALDPITNNLNVTCSGATLVGIKAIDNRPHADNEEDDFGLGLDSSGAKIGWFNIKLPTPTVNSATGTLLRSTDDGVSWTGSNPDTLYNDTAGSITSWNIGGGSDPVAVTTIAQPIEVRAYIAPENTLDTSSDITIDGSATIELVYL